MMDQGEDTICALASGAGRAGVAVIRVSGPMVPQLCLEVCKSALGPRMAEFVSFRDLNGSVIDQGIAIRFEEGSSFTGEHVVEFQTHGSRAVVLRMLDDLCSRPQVRMAEPGEFTRRAFENGKLDLTQVEGLADLIEAETESQRAMALDVLSGKLSRRLEVIRASLLRAMALLEATIDFSDEDVPVDVYPEVRELLHLAKTALVQEISGFEAARIRREGFSVALIGAPNAGKSTLLNALAGREAAIVSDIAGTTRDVIEVTLHLSGLPVTLLDTAGLRDTDDVVEAEGVKRTIQRSKTADLRVLLSETGNFDRAEELSADICLATKIDLSGRKEGVSALTGAGLEAFEQELARRAESAAAGASLSSHVRQRALLVRADDALDRAFDSLEDAQAVELVSFELGMAARAVDSLVGRIDVEDVLGEIFSSFCIGK